MMLYQITALIILGCFCPAVFGRPKPSVSLQNDGNGHYKFEYDVYHPKGSSRGHMRFGATSTKHTGSHALDPSAGKYQANDNADRSPLSSAHNPDSYRAEKEARRPHDYANSPYEPEIHHEPRPIYPSPYDSAEKQLGGHDGAHEEIYNPPVSKVNHQSPVHHSASVPEANFHPQSIHNTNGPEQSGEQYGHPNNFVSSDPVLSQEPISQDSVPAFNAPHEGYAPNQGDSYNAQPVPVGPNYQFIPSGPPYVVDSHSTEIIHPPLPKDPIVVQQPVDVAPHPQEVIPIEQSLSPPPKSEEVIQPSLSHAFQLPLAPISGPSPILSVPKNVQQSVHDDEFVPPPSNPILVNEPVDPTFHSNQPSLHDSPLPGDVPPPISHAFRLPLLPISSEHSPISTGPSAEAVQATSQLEQSAGIAPVDPISPLSVDVPPPISHAFRLPLLPISSEHSPIPAGPSAEAVQAISNLEQSAGIAPIDPISHSTRLLIPGPTSFQTSGAPKDLSLGHESINLGLQNVKDEPVNGDLSEINSHALPPISHAFRLGLPSVVSNQPAPTTPELKPIETVKSPSPFTEVESPEVPQLPQLLNAHKLNLPNEPEVEYFPSNEGLNSYSGLSLFDLANFESLREV